MEKRPVLSIPLTSSDRLVEALAGFLLVALIVFSAVIFPDLPERIPAHFDFKGNVDRWGAKGEILLLPLLGLVEWVLLTWLNQRPHIFNYPGKITEENAFSSYRSATRLLRFMKCGVLLLFSVIQYNMYAYAIEAQGLPFWSIGIVSGLFPLGATIWLISFKIGQHKSKTPV